METKKEERIESAEKHTKFFKKALLIRKVEERLLDLYAEGKLNGTVHTCVGQELTGVAIAEFLEADDFVTSNHRGHGHYIARTGDVDGLIAEVMGKTSGCCNGIGGSQHLVHHKYLSNGIQGGMSPIAAGVALANRLKETNAISVVFIGDGTLGEGLLYETFNLCAIWNLPVLFVLENNRYAQSTSFKQTFGGEVESRARGFGLDYFNSNTWSLDKLLYDAEEAVNRVRGDKQPALLEIETYRLNSHSKGDDNRRDEEVIEYKKQDILNCLKEESSDLFEEWSKEIESSIATAVESAENAPTLEHYPNQANGTLEPVNFSELTSSEDKRINEIIYESLKQEFEKDEACFMLGEDIEYVTDWTSKPYGGAFKVSRDLSTLFKGRVRNTPISEGAIVGIGTGLALEGMKPVVEIMFGDFMTLTFDQLLQHACKFRKMYAEKVNVPLIIRTPMGGKRGYGPTHSQSLEKFFLGIPDLNMIALNHRISPRVIYQSLFNQSDPCLVIENKILYTRKLNENPILGFNYQQSDESFPTLKITPEGVSPDLTIVCYGGILEDVEKAVALVFDEEEILCEVICPSMIQPLNIYPILQSVKQSQHLLIVEEGTSIAALGAEISAQLMENNIVVKKFSRLGNNTIIPCSYVAENNLLPNPENIFKYIKSLMNEHRNYPDLDTKG